MTHSRALAESFQTWTAGNDTNARALRSLTMKHQAVRPNLSVSSDAPRRRYASTNTKTMPRPMAAVSHVVKTPSTTDAANNPNQLLRLQHLGYERCRRDPPRQLAAAIYGRSTPRCR